MARNKGAAAALDFFIWGSGHGYLGYRKALGLPWVLWTFVVSLFTIIAAFVSTQTTAFYYVDYSTGFPQLVYNSGEAALVTFVPYLVVGGLLIVDLIRRGALPSFGPIRQTGAPVMQQQMSSGMVCPTCGTTVTAADAFCPSCGATLRAAAPMAPNPVGAGGSRVCNSCGTANPAGYNFCKRCGSRLA